MGAGSKMLILKGEFGTPGKIRTYDLLLRRQEHLRYVVDATGAIERLRGSKRAYSALFDAPFDALAAGKPPRAATTAEQRRSVGMIKEKLLISASGRPAWEYERHCK
jgi:hypothetical protein